MLTDNFDRYHRNGSEDGQEAIKLLKSEGLIMDQVPCKQ
jgi:hypothetical protein